MRCCRQFWLQSVGSLLADGQKPVRPQWTSRGLKNQAGFSAANTHHRLVFFSLHLQDARQKFRSALVEATVKLDELVKKIGKAVDESKPYWEARRLARQVSQILNSSGINSSCLLLKIERSSQRSSVTARP